VILDCGQQGSARVIASLSSEVVQADDQASETYSSDRKAAGCPVVSI
jgi:hypothetical protein